MEPAIPEPGLPTTRAPLTPLCADLRSKKYYFLERPATSPAELLDASNDCWCARTGMRMGPDDGVVDAADCASGRACYRRAGAERPTL